MNCSEKKYPETYNFGIESLGKANIESPLNLSTVCGDKLANYVKDDQKVLLNASYKDLREYFVNNLEPPTMEEAGPREFIYFDPTKVKAAIVTCGGLCPGLNDVIRAIVMELWYRYGTKSIYGIRYGYEGFIPKYKHSPIELNPEKVTKIHFFGGSILGSSRGPQDISKIVDTLERMNISMIFTIGGDGTARGAHEIYKEITKRNLKIGVVGIPKTIDNDISFIDKTFGFETAFSSAAKAINSAHSEAISAHNGIGMVKLMGRHSGYIAANAALALKDVNFVLIPEMDFDLHGKQGFLNFLKLRLESRKHAVIVVAEGVGQDLMDKNNEKKDASGNVKLMDIGVFLKKEIQAYFKKENIEITIKYIDPSYMIRSTPAIPTDSIYCGQLGQNAVHAAMAGKTDLLIGSWKNEFVHIPILCAVSKRKKIDLEGDLWWHVLEATGQPMVMKNS